MTKQAFDYQPLNLNDEPDTILCDFCHQPKHALKLNENVMFWVHHGKELEKCRDIDFKTSFLHVLAEEIKIKQEILRRQIPDGTT